MAEEFKEGKEEKSSQRKVSQRKSRKRYFDQLYEDNSSARQEQENKNKKINLVKSFDDRIIMPRIIENVYAGFSDDVIFDRIKQDLSKLASTSSSSSSTKSQEVELPPELIEHINRLIQKERRNYQNNYLKSVETKLLKYNPDFRMIQNMNRYLARTAGAQGNLLASREYSTFIGYFEDILVGLLYIVSKHSDVCFLSSSVQEESEVSWRYESKKEEKGEKEKEEKEEVLKYRYAGNQGYWTLSIPERLYSLLLSSSKRGGEACSKRFVVCILDLVGQHANALVFDKKLKTFERFEPNGSQVEVSINPLSENYNYPLLDQALKDIFQTELGYNYLPSLNICPYVGPQFIESAQESGSRYIGDPLGFCAAWSLLYIDARLSNPDIPPDILVDLLLKQLATSTSSSSTTTGAAVTMRDFIRGYSNFIVDQGLMMRRNKPSGDSIQLLKEKLASKVEERKMGKIFHIDGPPWSLEKFSSDLRQKSSGQKNIVFFTTEEILEGADYNYQRAVEIVKILIQNASTNGVDEIYFLGSGWFKVPGPVPGEVKNIFDNPSTSLFNIRKLYVSNVNDILPWMISSLFSGIDFDQVEKLLKKSQENGSQEENIEKISEYLADMVEEKLKEENKTISRDEERKIISLIADGVLENLLMIEHFDITKEPILKKDEKTFDKILGNRELQNWFVNTFRNKKIISET